jgi:hypothetical protein
VALENVTVASEFTANAGVCFDNIGDQRSALSGDLSSWCTFCHLSQSTAVCACNSGRPRQNSVGVFFNIDVYPNVLVCVLKRYYLPRCYTHCCCIYVLCTMYVYVLDADYTCQSHSFIRYWIESGLFSFELSWINTCIQRLDVGSSKGTLEKLGHEKAHRRLV